MIDPNWRGQVSFYELVFGIFLSYLFLVLLWERFFKIQLEEWRYIIITFLGASFFLINHYFQNAPFYRALLYGYTLFFLIVYYFVAAKLMPGSIIIKLGATLSGIIFTLAFILFENLARWGVDIFGIDEFWFMLIAYFGYVGLILWRARVFSYNFQ